MSKPIVVTLWALNAGWTLAIFATPLLLPAGTVTQLSGHANLIDHDWSHLPVAAQAVYWAGDLTCHQLAARSWSLGGNQMPIDARMTAGFVAGLLGIALAVRVPTLRVVRDEAVQLLPRRIRTRLDSPRRRALALAAMWIVSSAPLLVDVAAQALGAYESTNLRRAWTGALFGVGVGFLVAVLFDSTWGPPRRQDVSGGDGTPQRP